MASGSSWQAWQGMWLEEPAPLSSYETNASGTSGKPMRHASILLTLPLFTRASVVQNPLAVAALGSRSSIICMRELAVTPMRTNNRDA